MNISYNWLKELIDIDLPASELAEKLTRVGLAVDGLHQHGDDFVLDIDLTSNRPDCLSHLGVAREIAVITGTTLTAETQKRREGEEIPFPAALAHEIVKIENPELCYRFTARIIRNVKIGPSPKWLVDRLDAIGERSINNVADITNYVMHELGQPMHSFDLDRLAENRIVVRAAKPGEAVKTLDEGERKLDASMLAICDAEKPVAVAGVMGGFDSGITENTTSVLLEVAYFKRENVRQTSRKLNLNTEASYRFERGVDIMNLKRASDRATDLIVLLAGGKAGDFIDVFPTPIKPKEVESKDISAAVKRLTGLVVEEAEGIRILNALGIGRKEEESANRDTESTIFIAPPWRHDIAIEEDLVEEVARHVGYDKISDELPPAYGAGEYQATEPQELAIRQNLADAGFDEAINYSFIDTRHDDTYETVLGLLDEGLENKFVEIRDPVIEGAVRMRPTLLPGLLDAVRLNFNQQNKNLMLFELGKAFGAARSEEGLPNERELLALALTGSEISQDRAMPGRELDFYDAKGAVETALDAAGYQGVSFFAADAKHLRSGQSAAISVSGRPVGTIGRLNEEISANYKFRQPVYVAEIDIQAVLSGPPEPVRYAALSKYPSVVRDVSFTVGRDITFDSIRTAIKEQGIELCRSVSFVDLYEGKALAQNERSLTIRLQYRSDERTLIEDDVEQLHTQLVRTLEEKLRIKQRI